MNGTSIGKTIKLQINSGRNYLHVVTSFVKNTAQVFGMDEKTSVAMALASEEIFVYMCSAMEEHLVEVKITDYIFKMSIEFHFRASVVNMKAFNITSKVVSEISDHNVAHIGLFIAARLVDSFELSDEGSGFYTLRIEKEKRYSVPKMDASDFIRPSASSWTLRTPTPDEVITQVSMLNLFQSSEDQRPPFLQIPKKVADMFASGLLEAIVAYTQGNLPCGIFFWQRISAKAAECFGPYSVLDEHKDACSRELLDYALNHMCKKDFCIVSSQYILATCATGYFEKLTGFSEKLSKTVFYRQLNEDPGGVIWISPSIENFVKREKERMFLPRTIFVQDPHSTEGKTLESTSVIFTKLDHENMSAIMRPICFGSDAKTNICAHLKLLISKNYHDIVFELDLGIPWHSLFATILTESGFEPEFLFPSAGLADVLIMRYVRDVIVSEQITPPITNGVT